MTPIERYRSIAQPPPWALKKIGGGRLKGMTDIKPAWRIQAITEQYGLCGFGWKFEVVEQRTEQGSEGQIFAFVDVLLYLRLDEKWSEPIPGAGGSMLVEMEKSGLHSNDEAFKMATTDALSSAMKLIGMASDVYAGQWDGSKYARNAEPAPPKITAAEQKQIDKGKKAIDEQTSTEGLNALGEAFAEHKDDHSIAVQAELRKLWGAKNRELKKKETPPPETGDKDSLGLSAEPT